MIHYRLSMFTFTPCVVPEVILITPKSFHDERGFFMETYRRSAFAEHDIRDMFLQDNHSKSLRGVLRGLHFQIGPTAQAKLVRCPRGEIFDVAVDMRSSSPTYLKWVGVNLSSINRNQLFIPAGFAHGFCVISDEAETIYKCSQEYDGSSEHGIVWNDPRIGIQWPINDPILSEKDKMLQTVDAFEDKHAAR